MAAVRAALRCGGFILALWMLPAAAARETGAAQRIPCGRIKLALWAAGIDAKADPVAARDAARARGYSEAEIADAERRCLK